MTFFLHAALFTALALLVAHLFVRTSSTPRFRKRAQHALTAIALLCLAVVAWDLATGGIYFTVFGIVVSSWEISKPITYAAICGALALWLRDHTEQPSWTSSHRWAPAIAALVAIASSIVAAMFCIRAAGGADAYGYISEARLWAEGRLIVPDELAALEPQIGPAFAPLGYIPATTPGAIVPIYSPGLPLAMALAQLVGGPAAVYVVVPLLAGIAVWATFLLGARADDNRTGLMAAIFLASSPLFLFHTFEPMSDVPAARSGRSRGRWRCRPERRTHSAPAWRLRLPFSRVRIWRRSPCS